MKKYDEKLEIVDENDNTIGQERRSIIHKKGLLHREAHVWFFNDSGEVFLQHRKKTAETFPDLLDVTVGGHVEIGDTYIETAVKETEEETGVRVKKEELIEILETTRKSFDEATGLTNRAIGIVYAYRYNGKAENLTGEEDMGFEVWKIDDLLSIEGKERKKFLPSIFNDWSRDALRSISQLVIS